MASVFYWVPLKVALWLTETLFKTLKAELIWRQTWKTGRQAEAEVFQYVNGFYNARG